MSSNREFDYHLGGIEDEMIGVLTSLAKPEGYVRTVDTYGGEFDAKQLREALDELLPSLPLMLVSYAEGTDVPSPATPPVHGEPFVVQHRAIFSVVCCSGDARGEKARRRGTAAEPGKGTYGMLADARRLLSGLKFQKQDEDETVLLNTLPLTPAGVDFIARLPELTAYAQNFYTTFSYRTPDRRVVIPGDSVAVGVAPVEGSRPRAQQAPGVIMVT